MKEKEEVGVKGKVKGGDISKGRRGKGVKGILWLQLRRLVDTHSVE